ncbi:polymorphic toxin type 15 domain-containing protein [Listeria welshimeri]|uniref:polymorphic toxin type 15 domain-containing protein n=1 Tax=Listeria welshimeri TaxID=1643 RepID=UPI001E4A464C|nr:polymorphic toxin type 15 domain-containing protein [Listeria welshimeri]
MKDINYQEDDWREAKSALAPFAAANWMGGLFNNLVKVAENMEEAEADIQELDSDGAISFQHTNHTGKYSTIEEDLLVLYKFCCHAGERMENLVNLPFYEKLDAFVGGMQELSISTYATTNRMEVKEQRTVTTGEYAQSFETIKAEVTMEDLLNGDNFYANQMQLQYRDWKRANPDQDVSEADFKMSMIHTRAFEYKSIKNEQEEKEFWVSIVATVGIIAVSVLCPPAGLALSVAYGGLEISSAVSGKDWFSGRELSTGERYTRAGFGVLDVIPGVKAFTTGAKAVGTGSKLLRLGDNVLADSKNIGRLAKGTMGEGLQAGKQAMHLRLSNAQKIANQAGANVQRKLAKDWNDLGAAAKAIQGKAKQAIPLAPRERLALAGGGSIPEQSVAGASAAATKKKLQEMMRKMNNLNVKGSGKNDIIKGASRANKLDDIPRLDEIKVNFNRNLKHDPEEFARQLKDQEKGMNELTVDEYLKNRERYIAEGRALEGNAAQQAAREEAYVQKVNELQKNGLSLSQAKKEAREWLDTQAALHNPDQIAGGKADIIGGMGDKGINSSIGSQWRYRIDIVDEQIRGMAKNMTPEQLKNTYLNVKLTR